MPCFKSLAHACTALTSKMSLFSNVLTVLSCKCCDFVTNWYFCKTNLIRSKCLIPKSGLIKRDRSVGRLLLLLPSDWLLLLSWSLARCTPGVHVSMPSAKYFRSTGSCLVQLMDRFAIAPVIHVRPNL